jgi:hypothetical protein
VPILGLACVNDVIAACFVHSVYSLAVSIRKPLPAAVQQNPRIEAGVQSPLPTVTAVEGFFPMDYKKSDAAGTSIG